MNTKLKAILISFCYILAACGGNDKGDSIVTRSTDLNSNLPQSHDQKSSKKIPRLDTLKLENKGCGMELITEYLYDSLADSILMVKLLYPPVVRQKLTLYNSFTQLPEWVNPYGSRKVLALNGDSVTILQLVIWSVGIADNGIECFFTIDATEGCNACMHFSELLTNSGKILHRIVYDLDSTYEEKGVFLEALAENGIDEKKFRRGEYLQKQIPWW